MAGVTLGHMLHIALGSSRDGVVDFEQLHNLLNGLLLHLGLKDLLVQENGEPLEGAEESPFAFLKGLKERLEANEKQLAEVQSLCQELREEVVEMKLEQARVAENMQKIMDNIDVENFQNMLEDLRQQLLDSVMAAMRDMNKDEGWMKDGRSHTSSWDDPGLIVIGNEITLLERTPVTRTPQPSSPPPPSTRTQGREDLLEANASGHPLSSRESDRGQTDTGWNTGRSDMGRKGVGWNVGQSDTGQKDMRWNTARSGMGQKGKGWKARSSDTGRDGLEQSDVGQIKDEEIKTSTSKTPPHIQRKSPTGGFTPSGMHPGAPGTRLPVQRVQSVRGHPGCQALWIPAENEAGTSKLLTSKEARGTSISRIELPPAEEGLMLLKVPSSEYSPCDQPVQSPGRHSEIPSTPPPPSPGLSARLPRALKSQTQEHREQAVEGYSRRSPMYCGGKHTSICPMQPMEPLLPDPNKPGVIDLVGTDGLVYRGRTAPGPDSAHDSSPQK